MHYIHKLPVQQRDLSPTNHRPQSGYYVSTPEEAWPTSHSHPIPNSHTNHQPRTKPNPPNTTSSHPSSYPLTEPQDITTHPPSRSETTRTLPSAQKDYDLKISTSKHQSKPSSQAPHAHLICCIHALSRRHRKNIFFVARPISHQDASTARLLPHQNHSTKRCYFPLGYTHTQTTNIPDIPFIERTSKNITHSQSQKAAMLPKPSYRSRREA